MHPPCEASYSLMVVHVDRLCVLLIDLTILKM